MLAVSKNLRLVERAGRVANLFEERTMRFRIILLGLCLISLVALGAAQDKVSGSAQCAKPDLNQSATVPDNPGHTITLSQYKCSWTKPMEIAGMEDKDGVDTAMADVHGKSGHSHGYYVDNMANGDKGFVRWEGMDMMDTGGGQGKWTYTGGTGKLKGIKGGGTYKATYAQDGSASFDVEGEYTLPK